MTLLVMPTLSCNLRCIYCYNRLRHNNRIVLSEFDGKTMAEKAIALAKITNHCEVVLHGGEPLLWNIKELHKFIDTVTKAGIRVAIQTNGTLITDKHIELFKRYNVGVGISIDGDEEIGITRGYWETDEKPKYSLETNKRVVRNVLRNIKKLYKSGINVGIIIVLTKYNFGDDEKIEKLAKFIKEIRKYGVKSGRLNPAFGIGRIESYELSWKDLLYGYKKLWSLIKDLNVQYSPYVDFSKALMGNFRDLTCWFHGCGYFDSLVWTILPDGKLAPCDRVVWYGKNPLRVSDVDNPIINSRIRVYALLQTELKNSKNGHIHRGGCPAESPDGDWRRASRFWKTWDEMIEFMADEIKKVIPNIMLPNSYHNKLEFVSKIDKGCYWHIWEGRIVCP